MKKILVVCLLGIGMLLPALQTTAKAKEVKKIVDIHLEEDILIANSQSEDGPITKIVITNSARQMVLMQACGGYSCEVYVGDLPAGPYTAQIVTPGNTHVVGFMVEDRMER